ncbi:L-fucose:H+ symporter permease [Sphingomonas sp. PR090111-T3T-6A]|uniref:L-fucose:H+ symporter permease n=1 Tax=Sphingomonas sp. PR090111-T3T-6A TaxID=685778 RepID=UPI00036DF496|nr:L-fucose:H+ symporter permease [Sphingomonas sp. PR090111-T3T-6A]
MKMIVTAQRNKARLALVLTICLYALWGMAHNLNDILITQFKKAFLLSDLQSSLVQSCFYVAYLVMPIPVALFMQRFSYKRGVIAGLCLYGVGALLFWPAAAMVTYPAFLGALFVIACGLTFLETAGTGIIVVLGRPERAEWRINVAQAFNPLGAISGVLVGRQFIFSARESAQAHEAAASPAALAAYHAAEAQAVQMPYLVIGLLVLTIALLVAVTRFPAAAEEAQQGSPFEGFRHLRKSSIFLFGVLAQFFYVGTQIGVWSFTIRYAQHAVPGTPERLAALYLTVSLVCFLLGRFASLLLLRRYSSAQIAMVFAAAAALLTMVAILAPGPIGILSLIAVSFFMSVMFPAIYAIGLHGHAEYSKPASALMIMSITGGAVLAALMGAISDHATIAVAYVVPLSGFLVVFTYCTAAVRAGRTGAAVTAAH